MRRFLLVFLLSSCLTACTRAEVPAGSGGRDASSPAAPATGARSAPRSAPSLAEDLDAQRALTAERLSRAAEPSGPAAAAASTPSGRTAPAPAAEPPGPEIGGQPPAGIPEKRLELPGGDRGKDLREVMDRRGIEAEGGVPSVESFTDQDEARIGEATARSIHSRYACLPVDAHVSVYVRKVGAVLVLSSGRKDLHYRFAVLDSDEVNAFAAPGGYVYVTAGALRFAKNEAELALILAHEIAHVEKKHGLAAIAKAWPDISKRAMRERLKEMTKPVEGEAGKRLADLEKRMDELSDLVIKGYGLPNELEADRIGLQIVSRAGYDAEASLAGLERLVRARTDRSAQPRLFRSHPAPDERIAEARKVLSGLPRGGAVPAERYEAAVAGIR